MRIDLFVLQSKARAAILRRHIGEATDIILATDKDWRVYTDDTAGHDRAVSDYAKEPDIEVEP